LKESGGIGKMKKFLGILIAAAMIFAFFTVFAVSCKKSADNDTKTVRVGVQERSVEQGSGGSVSFPVTTTGINDGTYPLTAASLQNAPEGVTFPGNISISGNKGTFTVTVPAAVAEGTYDLRLTVNSIRSPQFRLTVLAAGSLVKTVTVGSQSGTIAVGMSGLATFPVTAANIANGVTGEVRFYTDAAGTNQYTPPDTLMTGTVSLVENNAATATVNFLSAPAAATTMYIRVFIDGILSNVQTLTISGSGTKSVTVGAQSNVITAGVNRVASFPVTTTGIAGGLYLVSAANLPAGVMVRTVNRFRISDNIGALSLAVNASVPAGTHSNITFTIDDVTSAPFTLTISGAGEKSVNLGDQDGTITAGATGSVTFPVTTANIANGATGEVRFYTDARGTNQIPAPPSNLITATVSPVSFNSATATVNFIRAPTAAGTMYIRVFIDGILSNVQAVTILPAP